MDLETEPIRYCKFDEDATFIKPFQLLDKMAFGEQVNVF